MAEEETKKKFPMLMVVGLIVVGLILASGVSYFIAVKVMSGSAGKGEVMRDPGIFVKLGDPKDGIIVNVGGMKSGRFLKIGVVLEMNPKQEQIFAEGKILPNAETKLLDSVLHVLRSQKIEDFDPAKHDNLKSLIKEEVTKTIGEDSVYEVFITNFVLQ